MIILVVYLATGKENFQQYSAEIRDALERFPTSILPVASKLCIRHLMSRDTWNLVCSRQLTPQKKARLLVQELDKKFLVSPTPQDFKNLYDIMEDYDNLQKI